LALLGSFKKEGLPREIFVGEFIGPGKGEEPPEQFGLGLGAEVFGTNFGTTKKALFLT